MEDGGHVASGGEVAAKSSIVEMAERVVAGLGGEVEEVGSEGRPGRFAGEAGDVLVDRVEVGNNLGSEEVFGGGVEAVGVALDSVEQPGGGVVEFTQGRGGGGRRVVAGQDLLQGLGRGAGRDGVGADHTVGVAVADDLEVEVVGVPAAGEHGVELLPGFLAGEQAVHGVGGDALGAVDGGGVAEPGRGADVVGGQPGSEPAPLVPNGQLAVLANRR